MTEPKRSFIQALLEDKPQPACPPAPAKTTTTTTPYGRAVLDNHCDRMRTTPEGSRDDTMLRIGRLLGGYVGGGEIAYQDAHDQLWEAAVDSGLTEDEVNKIPRHLEYGMREPLAAPNNWTPEKPVTVVPDVIEDEPAGIAAKVLSRSQLHNLPKPQPLIQGLLTQGTTALVYGKWGSCKSFIALDWACCMATGKPWQTHPVKQRRVLYVAAEGVFGYAARVTAWEKGWNAVVDDDWLSFYPEPLNIGVDRAVDELCEYVRRERFDVVVLDTLARCTVGAEENSAKDVGVVIDAMGRVRDATPDRLGLCIGVHHEGKAGTLRGSTAYEGGVDTVFRVQKSANITVKNVKQKDMRDGDSWLLKLATIEGSGSCIIEKAHQFDVEPRDCGEYITHLLKQNGGRMRRVDIDNEIGYEGQKPEDVSPPWSTSYIRKTIDKLAADGILEKRTIEGVAWVQKPW